jgi:thiol-disulfide isomerase/thioredoxin
MKNLLKSTATKWTMAVMAGLATVTAFNLSSSVRAEDAAPTTMPATAPSAAARTPEAINADIRNQFDAVRQVMSDPSTLTDAAKRSAAAPKAIPVFKKILADFSELETVDPSTKDQVAPAQAEFTMFLALMGDSEAAKTLQTQADSKDSAESLQGKSGQLMIAWLKASHDDAAGNKVIDDAEKLAKANPDSKELTGQIYQMTQMGAPSKPQADRLEGIVTGVMKNEVADAIKQQIDGEHKLDGLENKPLTIAGTLLDGKPFTTADWKGKVILVDFWATWCGPCREELPRVEKMYSDYHAKGLEVLGVSNDMSADDLTKFVADNKAMPWPQLFDAAAAAQQQWNPITTGYGINGIPTMFLIDKKGVCRSVTAREKMEDLIPKLLAE